MYYYGGSAPSPDWQYDSSADAYYYDCPATYYCDGSAIRQLSPQPVAIPGDYEDLKDVNVEYRIFPLQILVQPYPLVNVDKDHYPFNYFFRLYAPYGKHFIWMLREGAGWGDWGYVVNEGGQDERGYLVVNRVVKTGTFASDLSPFGGGGAGPTAGGGRLPPFPIPI